MLKKLKYTFSQGLVAEGIDQQDIMCFDLARRQVLHLSEAIECQQGGKETPSVATIKCLMAAVLVWPR